MPVYNWSIYDVINFCNFHVEYLVTVNKFNAARLLNK